MELVAFAAVAAACTYVLNRRQQAAGSGPRARTQHHELFGVAAYAQQSAAAFELQRKHAPTIATIEWCRDILREAAVEAERTRQVLVASVEELEAILPELRSSRAIALDLEFSAKSFHGFVCTIQLSVPGLDVLVDVLVPAVRSAVASRLGPLLCDPSIIKVLHAGSNDVRWLHSNFGVFIVGLFDTAAAAKAVGLPIALGALLQAALGREQRDKAKYQRADWSRRPLPADMVQYALSDTHSLLLLAHTLAERVLSQAASPAAGSKALLNVLHRSSDVTQLRYDASGREVFAPAVPLGFALRRLHKQPEFSVPPVPAAAAAATAAALDLAADRGHSPTTLLMGVQLSLRDVLAIDLFVRLCAWRHRTAAARDLSPEFLPTDRLLAVCGHAAGLLQHHALPAAAAAAVVDHVHVLSAAEREYLHLLCSETLPSAYLDDACAALTAAVTAPGALHHRAALLRLQDVAHAGGSSSSSASSSSRQQQQMLALQPSHHMLAALDDGAGEPAAAAEDGSSSSSILTGSRAGTGSGAGSGIGTPVTVASSASLRAASLPMNASAVREAIKSQRARHIFMPRAAPLYSNIELLAPDGTVMARVDRKRAQWYLEAGAAVVRSGGEEHIDGAGQIRERTADDGCEPLRIQLVKTPRGPGHAGDTFHLAPRKNECAVCCMGWSEAQAAGGLVRCYIVPRSYRQHFPLAAKSYSSHEVVLTCASCHRLADVMAGALSRRIARELGISSSSLSSSQSSTQAPQRREGDGEGGSGSSNTHGYNNIGELTHGLQAVRRAAGALFNVSRGTLPPPRRRELIAEVRTHAWLLRHVRGALADVAEDAAKHAAAKAVRRAAAVEREKERAAEKEVKRRQFLQRTAAAAQHQAAATETEVAAEAEVDTKEQVKTDAESDADDDHDSEQEAEAAAAAAAAEAPVATAASARGRGGRAGRGGGRRRAPANEASNATYVSPEAVAAFERAWAAWQAEEAADEAAGEAAADDEEEGEGEGGAELTAADVTMLATMHLQQLPQRVWRRLTSASSGGASGTEVGGEEEGGHGGHGGHCGHVEGGHGEGDGTATSTDIAAEVMRMVIFGTPEWQAAARYYTDPDLTSSTATAPATAAAAAQSGAVAGGVPPYGTVSGLPAACEHRLVSFVRRWRREFLRLHPRALPPGWSVGYKVFSGGHRQQTAEPAMVQAALAHFAQQTEQQ